MQIYLVLQCLDLYECGETYGRIYIYMYIYIYWNITHVTLEVRRFTVGRVGRGGGKSKNEEKRLH